RPHRDRLQCSRALDPADRARAQKSSLRWLRRRRQALGGHRLAHRNLQDERRRSASLPARRAHQDRRASSHGPDRRATAVRLRAGGRQGCGLKTSLTLVKLARAIDWGFLEQTFGAVYTDKPGQPPLPTRLMAGLAILKHTYDLSDEALCDRW